MLQHFAVEDVWRLTPLNRIGNLVESVAIQARYGLDRNAGVVISTDDARVPLVNRPGAIGGIVDHVVEQLLLADGAVDVGG